MFNLSEDMILRQCQAGGLRSDSNAPIRSGESLEPCLRGADKIFNDETMAEMFKEIFLQENTRE